MARVLLLGGLDPSGGAGITVDATVVSLLGGVALPIAVANTVQGTRGFVRSTTVASEVIREQIATVLADGPVQAVKVGFVGAGEDVAMVAELVASLHGVAKLVVDPVLSATAGGMDRGDELVAAYREHLIPRADLVTPNTPELAALADGHVESLLGLGARAVLHKGGHGTGPDAIDELWLRDSAEGQPALRLPRPRRDCGPVRGTGCALASAIALHLANGVEVADACTAAGDWLGGLLSRVARRTDDRPSHLPFTRG